MKVIHPPCERYDCDYCDKGYCQILTEGESRRRLCAFFKMNTEKTCASCCFCEATERLYCLKRKKVIPFDKMCACASYRP